VLVDSARYNTVRQAVQHINHPIKKPNFRTSYFTGDFWSLTCHIHQKNKFLKVLEK